MDTRVDHKERLVHRLATKAAGRGFAIALDLLGDRASADDAVQEALARAWTAIDQLRDPTAAEGWFFRTLTRICLRVLRRRRLRSRLRGLIGAVDREALERFAVPRSDELLERRAEIDALIASLDRLPPKQRAALVLRYGHDMSVSDVADLLGVGIGTAKTHLARGLEKLRKLMEANR